MLYVYHGTNTHKVADRTNKTVSDLRSKRPLAQVFSFDESSITEAGLDELIEAQGLFVEKHIIVLRRVFENAEGRDIVLARLKRFAESQNIVILSESKLSAEHKRAIEKHAHQVEEHLKKVEEEKKFNVFALGDALGMCNRQALWVGYTEALRAGLEVENIHGTLHWAVRTMLATVQTKTYEEAGQKEFPYNKFKRFASNYTHEELRKLSRDLVTLYHESRRGAGGDLKVMLERWVLSI